MQQPDDVTAKRTHRRGRTVATDVPDSRGAIDVESVLKLNELPWLREVEPGDVRLGYAGATSLGMWLFDRYQESATSTALLEMMLRIDMVGRMTLVEELADVVAHSVDKTKAHRSSETIERWARIFTARYLAPTGKCTDRRDVGAQFECSAQRVSQICDLVRAELSGKSYVLPTLRRVLAATEQLAPCTIDACNEALATLLGPGVGIESVLAFAETFGLGGDQARVKVSGRTVGRISRSADSIVLSSSDSWSARALRFARDDCALLGCSSLQRVAGYIALEHEYAPGRQAIEFELQSLPGFVWLPDDCGWFTYGDRGATSALADRVRKMMAASTKAIELAEIGTALITDTRWLSRIGRSQSPRDASLPALHVLHALMKGWAWLRQVQYTRFEAAHAVPANVLTQAEALVVDLISDRGGAACTHEIVSAMERDLGLAVPTVSDLLASSPIVKKLEHSIYTIRGREIDDMALQRARQRRSTPGSG